MASGGQYRHGNFGRVRRKRSGEKCARPEEAAFDPIALVRKMGFEPNEKQAAVLVSTAQKGILNCSRQWGKSFTGAALAVCTLVRKPGCLVVVASPSKRQSAELAREAAGMLERLGMRCKRDGVFEVSKVLPNGSRLVGLPGKEATVRGLSKASLVLIDEASRVDDAMYYALRPMLALERGRMWLMSTPWSTRGFFYDAWTHGGEAWERVLVRATDCPKFSPEFLEEERIDMGPVMFAREYMGEFMQDEASAFDAETVYAAMDDTIAPLELGIAEFRKNRLRLPGC